MKLFNMLLFLIVFSCMNKEQILSYNENKINNDIIFDRLLVDWKISDSILKNKNYSNLSLIYPFGGHEKLTLNFDGERTYSLIFPNYDITGVFTYYSEVFFNQSGKPFAIISNDVEKKVTLFDLDSGYFFSNLKIIKNELIQNNLIKSKDLDKQCEIVKLVDGYMSNFSSLGRYSISSCLNTEYDFIVSAEYSKLYKFPNDSSQYSYIKNGTRLKYVIIDIINNRVKINNDNIYMIKVKSENGKIGWVFYNDDIIDIRETDIEKD